MSVDRAFVDTNVFAYLYSDTEQEKKDTFFRRTWPTDKSSRAH
jgi:predicted nucleic acid-binding protein